MHELARQYRVSTLALAFCALAIAASSTLAQSINTTIAVGSQPASLDVNTTTNKVYVANVVDRSVSVIDGATNTVTATITGIGTHMGDLAVNSVTNKIYVTSAYDGNVIVIDGATNTVSKVLHTGGYTWRISVNPVTNRIYVSDANSSIIFVLDGASDTVIGSVAMPSGAANASAVNTATNKIYVVNASNSVNVINGATNTIVGTIAVGSSPQKIAVNSATNRIYVANYSSSNVSVINGATDAVVTNISTSGNPFGVGIDTTTNQIIVPNQSGASADPIDIISGEANSVLTAFAGGDQQSSVAVNSFSRRAYVANQTNNGTVSVIFLRNEVMISEFRFRGLGGAYDEFIELYNNTETTLNVPAGGWTLRRTDTTGALATIANIPSGVQIPARGHYLVVNNSPTTGFTSHPLSNYPAGTSVVGAGDAQFTADLPDGGGIALFNSATVFDATTRLDAVGFAPGAGGMPDPLYREGTGIAGFPAVDGEYSFLRRLNSGIPQDSADNAKDFILVATDPAVVGSGAQLGAPGPENLASPVQRNATIKGMQLDACNGAGACVNRVRSGVLPAEFTQPNYGTFKLRRAFKNSTSQNITRLRFRVVDLSQGATAGQADLRVLKNSGDYAVTLSNGQIALLSALTREEPPTQSANGGGINTTLAATLAQPLIPGATINVEFNFVVVRDGNFHFFLNIEALTSSTNISADGQSNMKTGATKTAGSRKQK
jgi:YVTN family beta-propeller protein